MPKISKSIVDKDLRDKIFDDIFMPEQGENSILEHSLNYDYRKINDRQWGVLITDLNSNQRYIRIGAIVAEEREDMTAEELMNKEIEDYNAKQAKKAESEHKKAEKAAKDKAAREAKEKEKEE